MAIGITGILTCDVAATSAFARCPVDDFLSVCFERPGDLKGKIQWGQENGWTASINASDLAPAIARGGGYFYFQSDDGMRFDLSFQHYSDMMSLSCTLDFGKSGELQPVPEAWGSPTLQCSTSEIAALDSALSAWAPRTSVTDTARFYTLESDSLRAWIVVLQNNPNGVFTNVFMSAVVFHPSM